MPDLDAHLQAPARLKLMTTLTAVSEAEFSTLRDALDRQLAAIDPHLAERGRRAKAPISQVLFHLPRVAEARRALPVRGRCPRRTG